MVRNVVLVAGVVLLTAGCGPAVEEAQMRQLTEAVNELRSQIARYDQRTEALSNRLIMLSDRLDRMQQQAEAPVPAGNAPPALEVVRLEPPQREPEPEEPPIEIKLTGSEPDPLPVVAVPPVPTASQAAPTHAAADARFRDALDAFQKGQSAAAYELFADFLRTYPHHPQADNAAYWMGECRYERKEYTAAVTAFRRVLSDYPASAKTPDALLKLGLAYERLNQPAQAKRSFSELVARFPQSAMADLARSRLARLGVRHR